MKDGMANGPGIRTTASGQLQDGTFKNDLMDGMCLCVLLNNMTIAEHD